MPLAVRASPREECPRLHVERDDHPLALVGSRGPLGDGPITGVDDVVASADHLGHGRSDGCDHAVLHRRVIGPEAPRPRNAVR